MRRSIDDEDVEEDEDEEDEPAPSSSESGSKNFGVLLLIIIFFKLQAFEMIQRVRREIGGRNQVQVFVIKL